MHAIWLCSQWWWLLHLHCVLNPMPSNMHFLLICTIFHLFLLPLLLAVTTCYGIPFPAWAACIQLSHMPNSLQNRHQCKFQAFAYYPLNSLCYSSLNSMWFPLFSHPFILILIASSIFLSVRGDTSPHHGWIECWTFFPLCSNQTCGAGWMIGQQHALLIATTIGSTPPSSTVLFTIVTQSSSSPPQFYIVILPLPSLPSQY